MKRGWFLLIIFVFSIVPVSSLVLDQVEDLRVIRYDNTNNPVEVETPYGKVSYKNLDSGSIIEFDKDNIIKKANIFPSDDGVIDINGNAVMVSKGSKINVYGVSCGKDKSSCVTSMVLESAPAVRSTTGSKVFVPVESKIGVCGKEYSMWSKSPQSPSSMVVDVGKGSCKLKAMDLWYRSSNSNVNNFNFDNINIIPHHYDSPSSIGVISYDSVSLSGSISGVEAGWVKVSTGKGEEGDRSKSLLDHQKSYMFIELDENGNIVRMNVMGYNDPVSLSYKGVSVIDNLVYDSERKGSSLDVSIKRDSVLVKDRNTGLLVRHWLPKEDAVCQDCRIGVATKDMSYEVNAETLLELPLPQGDKVTFSSDRSTVSIGGTPEASRKFKLNGVDSVPITAGEGDKQDLITLMNRLPPEVVSSIGMIEVASPNRIKEACHNRFALGCFLYTGGVGDKLPEGIRNSILVTSAIEKRSWDATFFHEATHAITMDLIEKDLNLVDSELKGRGIPKYTDIFDSLTATKNVEPEVALAESVTGVKGKSSFVIKPNGDIDISTWRDLELKNEGGTPKTYLNDKNSGFASEYFDKLKLIGASATAKDYDGATSELRIPQDAVLKNKDEVVQIMGDLGFREDEIRSKLDYYDSYKQVVDDVFDKTFFFKWKKLSNDNGANLFGTNWINRPEAEENCVPSEYGGKDRVEEIAEWVANVYASPDVLSGKLDPDKNPKSYKLCRAKLDFLKENKLVTESAYNRVVTSMYFP